MAKRRDDARRDVWGALALLLIAVIVAACDGAANASVTPRPSEVAGPTRTDAAETGEPEPSASEAGESGPPSSADPGESTEPSAGVDDPFVGRVVATTVNRLRVRTQPGTSAESPGSLNRGTLLFVLDGPRDASGYAWYQVVPMAKEGASGWVAAASQGGVPWIEVTEATCPGAPTTVAELLALTPGERLACVGADPVTLTARLARCNCDTDTPVYDPSWFGGSFADDGAQLLLADPETTGDVEPADGIALVLDPEGDAEDPLPVDATVEVTGAFDHPAARACTSSVGGGDPEPDAACRFAFVVSSLRSNET